MIETWSLPTPAALVAKIVADLTDGRQCFLQGAPPPGLRRAIEDALIIRQIKLHVIYDDPDLDPDGVLRREVAGPSVVKGLASGIWWIDGVVETRVAAWTTEIQAMAERVRHNPPARRSLLAILVPTDVPFSNGLDVVAHRAEPLGRMDLEVAARYAATALGEVGPPRTASRWTRCRDGELFPATGQIS